LFAGVGAAPSGGQNQKRPVVDLDDDVDAIIAAAAAAKKKTLPQQQQQQDAYDDWGD